MTLPDEECFALQEARRFLFDLIDPKTTPRVPGAVRQRALAVLRHYPFPRRIAKIWPKK